MIGLIDEYVGQVEEEPTGKVLKKFIKDCRIEGIKGVEEGVKTLGRSLKDIKNYDYKLDEIKKHKKTIATVAAAGGTAAASAFLFTKGIDSYEIVKDIGDTISLIKGGEISHASEKITPIAERSGNGLLESVSDFLGSLTGPSNLYQDKVVDWGYGGDTTGGVITNTLGHIKDVYLKKTGAYITGGIASAGASGGLLYKAKKSFAKEED